MTQKMFSFVVLAIFLCGTPILADNMAPDNPSKEFECGPACKCGCKEGKPCTCETPQGWDKKPCGPACKCGCKEGKPCTCETPQGWDEKPCGPACKCGCKEGKPCTCETPQGWDKKPCGPACKCGCKEGKPCTCETPQGWDMKPCGLACKCGCKEGNPCTCETPQGWDMKPCGQSCVCGCNEGLPCPCPASQEGSDDYSNNSCCEDNSYSCGTNCGCGIGPGYTCSATNEVGCISGVCGVPRCCFNPCRAPDQSQLACGFDTITARQCCRRGVWLPDDPPLFRNLIADPRQICYSAGWRFDDQVLVRNVIDVSFGDTCGFYRWFDIGWCDSAMQLDLEGAVWVTFDPLHDSSPLMNADYYGGLVLTYAYRNLSFRLRGFHISCHIGDEFLLDHPDFDRRNPSAEFLDFFASYDLTGQVRLYGGIGWIVAQDDEFKLDPIYGAAGAEFRVHGLGFTSWCDQVYGEPILGMHFRFSKNFKRHLDATYVLGYEFGKLCGSARKLRFYLEYHDGYSLEGQFARKPTNYFSVRVSYGY